MQQYFYRIAGLIFTFTALASCAPCSSAPPRITEPARAAGPLLMVSIDGMRPDYLFDADKHGSKIPNLRRFMEEGSYATGVRGVAPTVTYPSHTTLMTGVAPVTHGIEGNLTFDPTDQNSEGWHWYADDIKAPTLFDAAARAGLITASFFWPVNVDIPATYRLAQIWRGIPSDDRNLIRALSTKPLLDEIEAVLKTKMPVGFTIDCDETRGRFVEYLLTHQRPSFTVFHIVSLDHAQHVHGPGTPEALAVLERVDAIVGSLRSVIVGPESAMAVVSDHGFVPVSNEVELRVALREAGLLSVNSAGKISDWKAASTLNGGTAAITVRDPLDAESMAKVAEVIQRLSSLPGSPVRRVFDHEALRATGGYSSATFVVELRPGYYFGSRLNGPLMVPSADVQGNKGTHGYMPDEPEMNASFFLVGAAVPKKHSLGMIDMRDVAPTLAPLLHLAFPSAEGRNLL